jgi:hypothetical protein
MMKPFSRVVGCLCALLLSLALATPQDALAQNHVVSPVELQRDVAASSASRQKNVAQVEGFLSSEEAQRAMKSAHVNYQEVKNAVRQLSNEDLAQLSARSEKAQKDFAAGTLSDRDLLIIIVAIAVIVLIIVAVR